MLCQRLVLSFAFLGTIPMNAHADGDALRKAVTLYLSFDETVKADHGGGSLAFRTRYGEPGKGPYTFEDGFPDKVFTIAKDRGIHGGALEVREPLPRNGRIFIPAKGNLAFKKGGWGGAVSFWMKTDPETLLKTKFCDPFQITQKGANNGGISVDFNDKKPRDFRMGVFPTAKEGQQPIKEDDPQAPLVRLANPGFKASDWHHVVVSWTNLDTGRKDAHAVLYLDGKAMGEIKDRELSMDWDIEKAGVYIGVNYVGLLDEFAVFGRALTVEEVALLKASPGLLAPLRKR